LENVDLRLAISAAGLAFKNFIVHRASTSFCRALAGFSGQISAAVLPDLIAAFSASPVALARRRPLSSPRRSAPPGR
jgi:hypothetical protein